MLRKRHPTRRIAGQHEEISAGTFFSCAVFDGCRGGNDLIATCHCHCHNFHPSPSPSLSGLLIFLTRQISYHNEGNKQYSPTPSRVHRLPSNGKSPMCGGCQEVTVLHRRRYYSVRRTMYSCVTPILHPGRSASY